MFANTKDFFKKTKYQFISIFEKLKMFIEDSKQKFHNLYKTNYDTGMYHLDNGNLWDATFRFKMIKRFWPNKLEAQYRYAYCLILQGLNSDAQTLLKEILEKDSNYTEAKDLLNKIENNETERIVSEFNTKFNIIDNPETKKNDDNK